MESNFARKYFEYALPKIKETVKHYGNLKDVAQAHGLDGKIVCGYYLLVNWSGEEEGDDVRDEIHDHCQVVFEDFLDDMTHPFLFPSDTPHNLLNECTSDYLCLYNKPISEAEMLKAIGWSYSESVARINVNRLTDWYDNLEFDGELWRKKGIILDSESDFPGFPH